MVFNRQRLVLFPVQISLIPTRLTLLCPAIFGLILAGIVPTVDPALAQDVKARTKQLVEQLKSDNPGVRIRINPKTGLPSSISGLTPKSDATRGLSADTSSSGEPTENDIRVVVETWLNQKGLTAATRSINSNAEFKYKDFRPDRDFPDKIIARVEQRVNDIPVFGSTAKVTVQRSLVAVTKFSGSPSPVAISDTTPTVTEQQAKSKAREYIEALARDVPSLAPGPVLPMLPNLETASVTTKLMIFDPVIIKSNVEGDTRLAWLVTIDSFHIFVDAKEGNVFHSYQRHPTAGMVRRIFDLGQSTSLPGTKVIDEDTLERVDRLEADVGKAFQNTALVRDFFFVVLGRNSYDDNDGSGPNGGAALASYVRHGTTQNAYWCSQKTSHCPEANVMVYGPGYAGALDIVGHEMTHGIIAHEANLIYSDEPGAVNESLSDIFGALIEFYAQGSNGNWLIGEGAPGFTPQAPLRSMENPHLADASGGSRFDPTAAYSAANRGQPDHFDELLKPTDELCDSTYEDDFGCVHFNSGILNKLAFLIAEGGDHQGRTVQGIGKAKLARLTYRALTAQLNENSGLREAVDGFLLSCREFVDAGAGGFVADDCNQVVEAQQAVGLFQGN